MENPFKSVYGIKQKKIEAILRIYTPDMSTQLARGRIWNYASFCKIVSNLRLIVHPEISINEKTRKTSTKYTTANYIFIIQEK